MPCRCQYKSLAIGYDCQYNLCMAKQRMLQIRITDEEYAQVNAAAKAAGVAVSEFVRGCVFGLPPAKDFVPREIDLTVETPAMPSGPVLSPGEFIDEVVGDEVFPELPPIPSEKLLPHISTPQKSTTPFRMMPGAAESIPMRWACGCTTNPATRMFNHAPVCRHCGAPYPGKKVKE